MPDVTLEVPLRALALGRRAERDDAADPRIEALRNAFDDAALAGRVAPLEQHAYSQALQPHPLLQFEELELQSHELVDVLIRLPRAARRLAIAHDAPAPLGSRQLERIALDLARRFLYAVLAVTFGFFHDPIASWNPGAAGAKRARALVFVLRDYPILGTFRV